MKKPFTTTQENDPSLDMSALIDVSFLLLIYFIVTSTLDPIESDLGMTLPGPPSSDKAIVEVDPMEIKIDALGQILVNEEIIAADPSDREVPALLDRLSTYSESARLMHDHPLVIVSADDSAKGQRFIDVLNALSHKSVDIKSVTISGF